MNITELRYLVAIRKWGSVSAAAKQLYAAQPNVSKALKNLEEEYGIRIFERSSTGMIPTEQGRHFIRQAERVLDEVDRLDLDARSRQSSCAELRVVLPHATYASYATVDFLQQMADSQQLRVHIRESGSMEALDHVLRRGYHLALLRYAEEDEDYYRRYCDRHGLHREPVMEFEYRLLTNREGPLAKCEVTDITQLNSYMEVLHGDFQLPGGEDSGLRWHTNPNRRIHVYERCSQFSILQNLPNAYMWASPMPKRALEQYHLVLRKCPAQRQRMKDVLVYPDRGTLRPEEQTFVQLLHKQAALTVKLPPKPVKNWQNIGMRKNRKAKEFGRQPQRFMRCGCLFADKSSEKETKYRLKNFAAIWSLICPHTRSILSLL